MSWTVAAATCVAVLGAIGTAGAASSSVTVTLDVSSATEITPTLCQAGLAGRTDLGTVLPGTSVVSSNDCTVGFGSSNDTSSLRVVQADGFGTAMYRIPSGSLDAGFNGGAPMPVVRAGTERGYDVAPERGGTALYLWRDVTANELVVERRSMTGGLDLAYAGDGSANVSSLIPRRLAVAADATAWVVGNDTPGSDDVAAVHLLQDGTPDPAVGAGSGYVIWSPQGGANHSAGGVAIASDGSIVVAGTIESGVGDEAGFVTWLEPDGTPRTSFGGGTVTWNPGAETDEFKGVALDSNGRVVVAGTTETGSNENGVVLRFRADGTLDPGFGVAGVRTVEAGATDGFDALSIDASERIVAAGTSAAAYGRVFAARLDSAGNFDPTFGSAGIAVHIVSTTGSGTYVNGVMHDAAGNVVVVGDSIASGGDKRFFAGRLTASGAPDTSFGSGGWVATDVSGGSDDGAGGSILADGRIAIIGSVSGAVDRGIVVHGSLPVADLQDTVDDWDQGAPSGMFGACLRAVTLAAATWTSDGSCGPVDSVKWRAVGTASSTVATAASTQTGAQAHLRFGVRTAASQPVGRYVTPITFEVLAPAA